RLSIDMQAVLALTLELHGFLDAPGRAEALDFAGGQAGLTLNLPIPGPIAPDAGLLVGLTNLSPERHGVDDSVITINGEVGLRLSLGLARVRVALTVPLWSADEALSDRSMTSQLMFQLGVGL